MRDVQRILGALTSPVRREILGLIWDRELPAGEIAAACNVRAPTVSQHLSVLREAGLVTMTAQGNFRRYRARQDVLRSLHDALSDRSAKWIPADGCDDQRSRNGCDVHANGESSVSKSGRWITAVPFG